jgi:hypothetical protein
VTYDVRVCANLTSRRRLPLDRATRASSGFSIGAGMSLIRRAVSLGPTFTGCGKRPFLIPAHHVDRPWPRGPIGLGPGLGRGLDRPGLGRGRGLDRPGLGLDRRGRGRGLDRGGIDGGAGRSPYRPGLGRGHLGRGLGPDGDHQR